MSSQISHTVYPHTLYSPAGTFPHCTRGKWSFVDDSLLWGNWKPVGPTEAFSFEEHIQGQELSSWVIDRDLNISRALWTQHFSVSVLYITIGDSDKYNVK